MCRSIVGKPAPRELTQHAGNPARNVVISGNRTVSAPAYGSPFIRNLDEGRRYATLEDFGYFVKLTYTCGALHHSGGTICEHVAHQGETTTVWIKAPPNDEDDAKMILRMVTDELAKKEPGLRIIAISEDVGVDRLQMCDRLVMQHRRQPSQRLPNGHDALTLRSAARCR